MDVISHDSVIEQEEKLLHYEGPDKVVSSVDLAKYYEEHGRRSQGFQFGVTSLDEALNGFEAGEVIVVSGPTAMGKTLFCDSVARSLKELGTYSLFFTFEVTPQKFVAWHSSDESIVYLPKEHKIADLGWLKQRCWEAKLKYDCQVVFVDHLHYILDMAKRTNMSMEIGSVMRFLKKEIALELDLTVFLVCHIYKLPLEIEPSINHLRDSSFVGQEADSVIMIWRRFDLNSYGKKMDTMDQGLAMAKVEKARRSGVMNKKIKLVRQGLRLVESLHEPEEEKHERKRKAPEYNVRIDSGQNGMVKQDRQPDPALPF